MLRKRNVNIKDVTKLDAFPKIPDAYTNKSAVGGTCMIFIYNNTIYR